MLLSDAIDEFVALRVKQSKPNTWKQEASSLRMLLAHVGNIQIKNIKTTHIEGFFYGEAGATDSGYVDRVKDSTFNATLGRVKRFLAWCERRGYVRRQLAEEIKMRPTLQRERMRLSPSQLLALLDLASNPRDRIVIALAMNTGMRSSEITTIKISDVNLEAGVIRVSIHKTKKEDMKPITKELDQELRRWLMFYDTAKKNTYKQTLQDDWYLAPKAIAWNFKATATNRQGEQEGVTYWPELPFKMPHYAVKRALAKLGLDGVGEGIHTIRRSVARAYFESLRSQGYDGALQATKAFLNHTSSAITEHYLGLTHERQIRDESLAGKPFLSAMVSGENVTNIADARRAQ